MFVNQQSLHYFQPCQGCIRFRNKSNFFLGENPSVQLGDSKTYGIDEFDGNKLYNLNTLKEGNLWLKKISNKQKIFHYSFPNKLNYKKE